jgi:hypothetical protein
MLPVLIFLFLTPVLSLSREVNWYVSEGRVASNADLIARYPGALSGAYLCCGFGHFNASGNFVMPNYSIKEYAPFLVPFTSTNRSAWIVMGVDTNAVQAGTWRAGLAEASRAAAAIAQLGVRGWIVDYEPVKNYTEEHAEQYGAFLGALSASLAAVGLRTAIDVAGWSILSPQFWPHYLGRGLGRFTSMTPTYSGRNVTENTIFVRQAMAALPPGTYAAGIGSTWSPPSACPGGDFLWNASTLPPFVDFLKGEGVTSIDMYVSSTARSTRRRAHCAHPRALTHALSRCRWPCLSFFTFSDGGVTLMGRKMKTFLPFSSPP